MKILGIPPAATIVALVLLAGCEDAEMQLRDGTGATSNESTPTAELRSALEALLSGRTDQAAGAEGSSWFSEETADVLRSVRIDSAGHATVDFHDLRPLIPNASSSAGSASLLSELNAAVFGVAGIRSVEYRMDGSCDLFWEWLQYGCHTVTRDTAEDWR